MSRSEFLIGTGLFITTSFLVNAAFNRGAVRREKEEQARVKGTTRLEAHHKDPRYKGGSDDDSNREICTLPEHALEHYVAGMTATTRDDRNANMWAVRKIVSRMTDEERRQFNDVIRRNVR